MAKITVVRRKDEDKNNQAQLLVVVYVNREKVRIPTKIKLKQCCSRYTVL